MRKITDYTTKEYIESAKKRLLRKTIVSAENDCWIWMGAKGKKGYGHFYLAGKHFLAHRASYILFNGEIENNLQIDHLCRNTSCVNPSHLEKVTSKENIRRGLKGVMRTSCIHGHPNTPENTLLDKGGVSCKICRRLRDIGRRDAEYWREYRRKRKLKNGKN